MTIHNFTKTETFRIDTNDLDSNALYYIKTLAEKPLRNSLVLDLLESLENVWNVNWGVAADILELLRDCSYCPNLCDRLLKIRDTTDLESEKSHHDWATEYVPPSPLRILFSLYCSWKKEDLNINMFNIQFEKWMGELKTKNW